MPLTSKSIDVDAVEVKPVVKTKEEGTSNSYIIYNIYHFTL